MDRRITSRLNMANAFKQVCDDNTAKTAKVPAFVALMALLATQITALQGLIKKLSVKKKGYAEDKTNWKERLSLLLSVLSGAGVAYARDIMDVVLEGKFDFAESTLSKMRDTELIETGRSVIGEGEALAAQLMDYGISADILKEAKDALDKFEAKNPLPIVHVYTDEAEREEAINKAFGLSDFVLQRMMKSAQVFKLLDPTFYEALNNASRISKVGVRHKEAPTEASSHKGAGDANGQLGGTAGKRDIQPQPSTSEVLKAAVGETTPVDAAENNGAQAVGSPSMNGA